MKIFRSLFAAATMTAATLSGTAHATMDNEEATAERFILEAGASVADSAALLPFETEAQIVEVGGASVSCLTEALYFEARGESVKGQMAVAEVIINRAKSGKFPNTICGVVNQGANRGKYRCQFSYKCDGRSDVMRNRAVANRLNALARKMISQGGAGLTSGATYYHTTAVRPSWSRKFTRTARIGPHIFYR